VFFSIICWKKDWLRDEQFSRRTNFVAFQSKKFPLNRRAKASFTQAMFNALLPDKNASDNGATTLST
jgi:hypothetical protein